MGSPSEITYPEKVASPPSSEKISGGGGEKDSDDDLRRRKHEFEKRSLAMATIQDDDERLLTRIGYKQVGFYTLDRKTSTHHDVCVRNFDESLQNGRLFHTQFQFLEY